MPRTVRPAIAASSVHPGRELEERIITRNVLAMPDTSMPIETRATVGEGSSAPQTENHLPLICINEVMLWQAQIPTYLGRGTHSRAGRA
jgi:hypothetical protein